MVIDCHYHLEERLLTVNELLQKMDQSGVDKTALMGLQMVLSTFLCKMFIGQFLKERQAFTHFSNRG